MKTQHNGSIIIKGIKEISYHEIKVCPEDFADTLEAMVKKRVVQREDPGKLDEKFGEEWVFEFGLTDSHYVHIWDGCSKGKDDLFPKLTFQEKALLQAAYALRSWEAK